MNKLGAVDTQFTGKKITGYDAKRIKNIAINLAAGDVNSAKQGAIEYMEDKESDTFRHIMTMLIATGVALAGGRKLGKPIVKNLSAAGDIVYTWIKKNANNGKKVVTEILDKEIDKKKIESAIEKIVPIKDYSEKIFETIGNKLNKMEIKKLKDVAEIGLGGLATYLVGGAANKFTDIVDDKTDEKRSNDINHQSFYTDKEWDDYTKQHLV